MRTMARSTGTTEYVVRSRSTSPVSMTGLICDRANRGRTSSSSSSNSYSDLSISVSVLSTYSVHASDSFSRSQSPNTTGDSTYSNPSRTQSNRSNSPSPTRSESNRSYANTPTHNFVDLSSADAGNRNASMEERNDQNESEDNSYLNQFLAMSQRFNRTTHMYYTDDLIDPNYASTSRASLERRAPRYNINKQTQDVKPSVSMTAVEKVEAWSYSPSSVTSDDLKDLGILKENFECFLCFDLLKDAYMCPGCSKMACYNCIKAWFSTKSYRCPHCRMTQVESDLVKCRWVNEVVEKLELMQQKLKDKEQEVDKDKCQDHRKKLDVYCMTCSTCVCSQCALFDSKHKAHSFVPLEEVVQDKINDLSRIRQSVVNKMAEIDAELDAKELIRETQLGTAESAVENFLTSSVDEVKILLDKVFDITTVKVGIIHEDVKLLKQKKTQMEIFLQQAETLIKDSKGKSTKYSASTIFSKAESLAETFTEVSRPVQLIKKKDRLKIWGSDQNLCQYQCVLLRNFEELRKRGESVYSTSVKMYGEEFRLQIWPNGCGQKVKGRYMSTFLELVKGMPGKRDYRFDIELVHPTDSAKNVCSNFMNTFEVKDYFGKTKFYDLQKLVKEGFIDQSGNITLEFIVAPLDVMHQLQDQARYIDILEAQLQQSANVPVETTTTATAPLKKRKLNN